ncbi:MAG: hypothetical protein Q4D33_13795, partial [Prevotellaceae bacterium]|nr:hypothetical protein [Prevotellaceae bacterium]
MKKFIVFILLMVSITTSAQNSSLERTEGNHVSPLSGELEGALVRISEIEVYPEYLTEYLEF